MVSERVVADAAVLPRSRSTRVVHQVQPGGFAASTTARLRKRSHSQNQICHDVRATTDSSISTLRLRDLPLPAILQAGSAKRDVRAASATPATAIEADRTLCSSKPLQQEDGNQEESGMIIDTNSTTDPHNDNNQRDNHRLRDARYGISVNSSAQHPPRPKPTLSDYTPRFATLDRCGDSSHLDPLLAASSPPAASPNERTRAERVCDEILATERAYVRDLKILLRQFFAPLQEFALKYTIDLGSMSALHASIRTIVQIHSELLRQLAAPSTATSGLETRSRAREIVGGIYGVDVEHDDEDWTSVYAGSSIMGSLVARPESLRSESQPVSVEKVVAAFDFTIEFMKVYALYCSSYLHARDELEVLQKTHSGLNALTSQLNEQTHRDMRVDIVSLMIKPVQRICQYPLLFRELLTHAPSEAEGEHIAKTLRKIEGVSARVNEKVRDAQNNARLYELYKSIDPKSKIDLMQPSRTLLGEMIVRVVSSDTPCWSSFLRRLGGSSRRDRQREGVRRSCDSFLSSSGHSSALESTSPLLSPRSPQALESPRISMQSLMSTRSPLLLRRSSGEKMRLILLSDMLLMARKQEGKLRIKRQLCLSCAHTAATDDSTEPAAAHPWSLVIEMAKVGRCYCHHLTPATLKRSPKRRSSLSMALQGGHLESLTLKRTSQESSSATSPQKQDAPSQRTGSRLTGLLRGSEIVSAFRSARRYVVICSSEQQRAELAAILETAIARNARAPAKALSSMFPSVSNAAKFSAKFWRALKPRRLRTHQDTETATVAHETGMSAHVRQLAPHLAASSHHPSEEDDGSQISRLDRRSTDSSRREVV